MAATTVQPSHAASPTGTTNLSHLPSELLIMIVDTILPGDVEAFTSTCQRIYQLSARRRSIHRALKKRYTNVKVDWDRSPGVGNPMKLLGEILLNQRYFVGHYVKSIYVHEGDLRGDLLAEEILDAFDGFNDLIHALPIFKNNEQLAYQVHNMLRHQDSDYLWLLLLSILPEIETIRLQPDFTQHEGVGYAFDAFGKLPHGIAPFSKLFKVTCEVPAADWNRISHAILPWFSIPSVRHVSARRWQCTSNHLPEIGHWMPACSNVQSIEFIDCVIDPEALSAMLKHVRLERFRYGEPYSQDSRVWDVAPIVAVLIEHQAETLLHLNMVGVPRESFEDAESTTKFMTLQPFKKLLTFEGHISMFPKVRNGGHRIKRDLSVDLHGVVPPTLEVLGLVEKEGLQAPVVDFYPDYISLQGLAAAPNLKTFTCVGIDLAKDARRALAAAGVWYKELETYKTASPLA